MVFLVLAFSFFAVIAILLLPLLGVIYFFRKKILKKIIATNYSPNMHGYENEKNYKDFEDSNNSFIEVDYEKKNEKDLDN